MILDCQNNTIGFSVNAWEKKQKIWNKTIIKDYGKKNGVRFFGCRMSMIYLRKTLFLISNPISY